jgi:5-oxoprolinase (ATP-hydrolysing)
VIVHPLAGVLSAWGLGLAELRQHATSAVRDGRPEFPEQPAVAALATQGCTDVLVERSVDARYAGAEHALNVPWSEDWERDFVELHQAQFGFVQEGPIELVAARVEAIGHARRTAEVFEPIEPYRPEPEPGPGSGRHGKLPVYRRAALRPGASFEGPALIVEDNATTWVEPGWRVRVDGRRWLRLDDVVAASGERAGAAMPALLAGDANDPVGLEVMGSRFMAIASRMGEHLRRVAHSTNIKERLDYSCALFDAHGGLIANAPHIPVHLGAMGETVAALLAERPMREGDVWLSNDPYKGGSHLPDLTVITPVFRRGALAFLVANRGHHADVGGPTPGSMPPVSSSIAEEGVLLSNERLVEAGRLREAEIAALLAAAGVRGVPERLADLRAQVASNAAGAHLLQELCDELGVAAVTAWMRHVSDNAALVMRDVLTALLDGLPRRSFRFADGLDDGTRIAVAIDIEGGGAEGPTARIDFSGTSPQHPGNRNAPRAVAVAAVLYVFRTLAARPIPLNAGCLRPLEIIVPPGSLLDPRPPAAVCGGNVETSQRLVDVLYGALDRQAAAQGTMNNVTFGDGEFGYYETVCGGAGAGFGWDGASAVHTHMTNTRITDVEVLERRCPVLVREFSIRRGSGGEGVWRGGDGVVRDLLFLRPLQVSVLAERRGTAPFGLRAGAGSRGEQQISPTSLRLLTPGGGGCSPSAEQWAAMSPAVARRLFREERWRGRTTDIATAWRHAQLVVVRAGEVEAALESAAESGLELLHRGQPGEGRLADHFGLADLATDLPLYRERDGRETSRLRLAPDEVALLFLLADGRAGNGAVDDWPALPAPHGGGAPGRLFITDRPA